MTGTILIAEDEDTARDSLRDLFADQGYRAFEAVDGIQAKKLLEEIDLDILLTDLKMPGCDGLEVLQHARSVSPQTLTIVITAHASVETAIQAMRLGAQDYILKPLIFEEVLGKVQLLMEHRRLAWENQMLRREMSNKSAPLKLIGKSPAMEEIFRLIEKVAPMLTTVLITGESGVGKEVAARTIHDYSPRSKLVFLPVNCSAIPETLLESQLFGYVKGAFTGATNSHEGLFQRAQGGTIFLDEIGEMPLSLQPKLLRAIEEKTVLAVGSTVPVPVDIRIIASTNRDLKKEVEASRFREDLFYRLNVFGICIPPLRERLEDIPPLVERLVQRHNQEMKRYYKGVDNATMRILLSLPWKGNVRELDNILERAMILGNDEWITPSELPVPQGSNGELPTEDDLSRAIEAYGKIHIERVIDKTGGDKKHAAELLGLSLSTLYRKLERLHIPY